MIRSFTLIAATLILAACGRLAELTSQTRTVAAPRAAVFAEMFGDGSKLGLPMISNGGSTRRYELVVKKGDPHWRQVAPENWPEAHKVKLAVALEIPREAHITYAVNDDALRTGLKFTLEDVAPDRTRIDFAIDELTGTASEGMTVNTVKMHAIAREALGKLDSFDTVKDAV